MSSTAKSVKYATLPMSDSRTRIGRLRMFFANPANRSASTGLSPPIEIGPGPQPAATAMLGWHMMAIGIDATSATTARARMRDNRTRVPSTTSRNQSGRTSVPSRNCG